MNMIAISELQKSPRKAINNTKGLNYILANNKKAAGLIDVNFLEYLENQGILEDYEDWLLMNDPETKKALQEAEQAVESGKRMLSFKEVFADVD